MMSTPVPQRVRTGEGQSETGRFPVQAIMRPGVSVQQILTTTGKVKNGGRRGWVKCRSKVLVRRQVKFGDQGLGQGL